MKLDKKIVQKQKRRWRIRKKIAGTAERPRLAVHFSNKHIYGQVIDDVSGKTLVYVSSLGKDLKGEQVKANLEGAQSVGKLVAQKAKDAKIDNVVFDRSGRIYHGCVKAFADAAREGGLKF
ncbi:MAG: 50S ribosomal protein L18 [Verrucomicrobiae bacterium]|nr:50S ribosomal protein L18 [Verrucomicrobiae bacterium]